MVGTSGWMLRCRCGTLHEIITHQMVTCWGCQEPFAVSSRPRVDRCVAIKSNGWLCGRQDIDPDWPQPLCEAHRQQLRKRYEWEKGREEALLRDRMRIEYETWLGSEEGDLLAPSAQVSIYFVRAPRMDNLIKIGFSRALERRLGSLAALYGGIELLGVELSHQSRERELHRRFADAHEYLEWFRPVDELLQYIDSLPPATRPPTD